MSKTNRFGQWAMISTAGVLSLSLSSVANASAGCDAANAGSFNRTAPANTNVFTQVGGAFANGDTIFATVTGIPLGVGVDLLPGPEGILHVNGANASGSRLVTTDGPRTIDITLAGGPGGPATLTFTCTPAGAGTSGGSDQSNTATTNATATATTTAVIVENNVVAGILGNAAQQDPTPTGPTQAEIEEKGRISQELFALREAEKALEEKIKQTELAAANQENLGTRLINEAGDDYEEDAGEDFAALLVPMDISGAMEDMEERQDTAAGERALARAKDLDRQAEKLKEELIENRNRQTAIEQRLKEIPDNPDDFSPDDLGDGESILFAPLDPFMRAINRYRGFTLNAAQTSSNPGPDVTPLSFTRTLDPKTVGWVRAVYTDYKQDDASQQDGKDVLVAIGAHHDFTDALRLGAFITAKWGAVKSPVNNLDIDTEGYSLGAYGRYRLGEEIDLNISSRLGVTKNDITVSGTTGSYDTRLASVTVGISGQEQLSNSVWMRPAISLTNTWVNREDYTNSAGTNIGGNTTWSGNISAGPTIGTSLSPPEGFKRFEPAIGLLATYTYSDADRQTGTVTASEDDYLSLSLSPQLSLGFEGGGSLDLYGSYFGIGADLDGWSIGGTFSIPLN